MAKIVSNKKDGELKHVFDCLIETKEYSDWKEKITDQILKSVEVKGYRKGKAPREKAMKEIDPQQLEQTIITETLQKHSETVTGDAEKLIKDAKLSSFQFDVNPEHTKETDKGFTFRLIAHLLPNIKLEELDSIKIEELTDKDITDKPSYKEFEKVELNKIIEKYTEYKEVKKSFKAEDKLEINMTGKVGGKTDDRLAATNFIVTLGTKQFIPGFEENLEKMNTGEENSFKVKFPKDYHEKELASKEAEFTVNVIKASRAKTKTLKTVIKNSEELTKQFKTEKEVKDYIKNFYDAQTSQILREMRQKLIIQEVVDKTSDFALPEEKVTYEIERIMSVISADAEKKEIKIGEAFLASGMPGSDKKGADKFTEKKVKTFVTEYVNKEFKLSAILSYIYAGLDQESKIKDEELTKLVEQAEKEKEKFHIPTEAKTDEVRNILTDRLVRQSAVNWLFDKFDPEAEEAHVHGANCKH